MEILLNDPLSQVLNLVILACKRFIRRYYPHMNLKLELLKCTQAKAQQDYHRNYRAKI